MDYAGIAKSEAFRRYLRKAAELQRVDLTHLTREEKVPAHLPVRHRPATVAGGGWWLVAGSVDVTPDSTLLSPSLCPSPLV